MIEMPSPIVEKMITVFFDRSKDDQRKVRTHIIIDFGKTDLSPGDAAEKNLNIIRAIRKNFHVELEQFSK